MKVERSVVFPCLLALVLALLAAPAVDAGDREESKEAEFRKIMSGLERGIHALKSLGMEEEAVRLTKIAKDAHRRFAHRSGEREAAKHQIEVMRLAVKAFLEVDRHDAAHRLEMKVRAMELSLDGHRDEEANRIREAAPGKGEVAELLRAAAGIWMESGHESKAETIAELARRLSGEEPRDRREGGDEGQRIGRHIEILRHAMTALREAERRDLVEAMERGVHALRMDLEGRKDPESMEIRERAPGDGDVAEILGLSSDLWKKFGNRDKAEACAELGEHYRRRQHEERERHQGRERPGGRERPEGREPHGGNAAERIEGLERQIRELMEMMDRLHGQLEELKRDTR